jgi:hypothetical protein
MTKTVTVQGQQKWDYCLETCRTENSLLIRINELGQQGWEVIEVLFYKDLKSVMVWTAFLKRPSLGQAGKPGEEGAVSLKSALQPAAHSEAKPAEAEVFDLTGEDFPLKTN